MQSGRMPDAIEIIRRQADRARGAREFLFVQTMENGQTMIVVSSWRTERDLRAYADSDMARDMLARLSGVLVEDPPVRNFAMAFSVEGDEGFLTRDEGGEG